MNKMIDIVLPRDIIMKFASIRRHVFTSMYACTHITFFTQCTSHQTWSLFPLYLQNIAVMTLAYTPSHKELISGA